MKILPRVEAAQELARALARPIVYLSGLWGAEADPDWLDHNLRLRAAPYIDYGQAVLDGSCLVVCETEEEQQHLYHLTYGDDGETRAGRAARKKSGYPPYAGGHRVYALTIGPDGELGMENT